MVGDLKTGFNLHVSQCCIGGQPLTLTTGRPLVMSMVEIASMYFRWFFSDTYLL